MADSPNELATSDQKAFLSQLGVSFPADVSRDRATELINAGVKNRDAKKARAEHDRKASVRAKKKGKKSSGLKNLIRLLLLFAVLGVLIAIFIPTPPLGDGSNLDEDRIRSARSKLLALENRPQSSQKFSEEEVNAYLFDITANRNQASATGTRLRPDTINVNLRDKGVDLTVNSTFTILPISYHLKLDRDGETIDLKPTGAKLGMLPMPGPLQQMIFHKMGAMFAGMPAEAALWRKLELFQAEDGSATVRRAL